MKEDTPTKFLILTLIFSALGFWATMHTSKEISRAALQPIILSPGSIFWKSDVVEKEGATTSYPFQVKSNIATNIEGYLVLKSKSYPIVFSPGRPLESGSNLKINCQFVSLEHRITWVEPDKYLCGMTVPSKVTPAIMDKIDGFYITYSDVNGVPYKIFYNKDFSPTVKRVISRSFFW